MQQISIFRVLLYIETTLDGGDKKSPYQKSDKPIISGKVQTKTSANRITKRKRSYPYEDNKT